MNSCGASVYYLHRNAAADSILLHAAGSAKYVEVSKVDGRVRRVVLALSPDGAEALLHSLPRATTVLYMYSVSSQEERLRLERVAMLEVKRELVESGGLNETAVDEVVAAALREPGLSPGKSGFCENVTVMVFVFEGGQGA